MVERQRRWGPTAASVGVPERQGREERPLLLFEGERVVVEQRALSQEPWRRRVQGLDVDGPRVTGGIIQGERRRVSVIIFCLTTKRLRAFLRILRTRGKYQKSGESADFEETYDVVCGGET